MVHSIFINAVSQERLEGIFSYSAQMFDQQFLISSSLNPISKVKNYRSVFYIAQEQWEGL